MKLERMMTLLKISVGAVVVLLIVIGGLAIAFQQSNDGGSAGASGTSHSLLESDRLMAQQMATDSQIPMADDGILTRSQNAAYLKALEEHSADLDKMLGRTP